MATNVFSPAVPHKAKDILLGEGALYKDYTDESSPGTVIGTTRGGTKLEIEWSKKEVDYDGSIGPTKGMRRTERFVAKLIVNFLKLTYTNLAYGLNVTVTDGTDADGTCKKVSFNTSFAATDIMDNITFRGFKANGEFCIIKLSNVLNIDNVSLEFKEKDEVVNEMTYTGFYTYDEPTLPPLTIREEITV